MQPRDAEVFIDGYYAGQVDDFDGRLQGLTLETGGYSVEIRKPGWETLTFDVRVTPGRTTTLQGRADSRKPKRLSLSRWSLVVSRHAHRAGDCAARCSPNA